MARVLFDSTFLALIWRSEAPPPTDPLTGQPIARHHARLQFLIQDLEARGAKVIVPTPALSELLVGFKDPGQIVLDVIDGSSAFEIIPFGRRAAIEAAIAMQIARSIGTLKSGDSSWQKVKVDRQIVAIAKVEQADEIYSEDSDVKNLAETEGIKFYRMADLPLPPEEPQKELDFVPDE